VLPGRTRAGLAEVLLKGLAVAVSLTMEKLLDIAALPDRVLTEEAKQYARFSLFDWLVAGRAGAQQKLSTIVRDMVLAEGGKPLASLFGAARKVPARAAALANGTMSHALDYDDTHFAHIGHPSVGIYPAALAIGEAVDASLQSVCDAFLLGAEASCRFGMVLGRGHYQKGFHQTATAGAIGATIAAGRLLGLDRREMQHALSLVATRASGLKSQFGSMGKPYNAGISAANGVEAAMLAKAGFESCDDGLGGPQGFIETHAETPDYFAPFAQMPPKTFIFTDIKYKLHACCHGTHAMIEALLELKQQRGGNSGQAKRVDITTNVRWLKVCDIKQPRTGLEVKFSYSYLAAMALAGYDTTSEKTFVDELCGEPTLRAEALLVNVNGIDDMSDTATQVRVRWSDGTASEVSYDLANQPPLAETERRLRQKATSLLGRAMAEEVWAFVSSSEPMRAREFAAFLHKGPN
jgi:2-methylcitrate dehydratase PrpD